MSKPTVLVVDDEEDIRVLLTSLLKPEGYDVVLAQDGASAMVVARHRDPDAIILDIGLPAGDGFKVLQRLRKTGTTTPVIVLTGREDDESRERAREAGASDYLTKPVDRDRLLRSLRRELQEGGKRPDSVHCPQCGWAIPLQSIDAEILEELVEEIRSRK